MKMKNALTVVAAAAFAVFAQGAFAQASAPTRAEVKAEAKGAKPTRGETSPMVAASGVSTKTRAERKAEAKAANKARKIAAGEETNAPAAPGVGPTTTRVERKAAAKAANKSGEIVKGESPEAGQPKK